MNETFKNWSLIVLKLGLIIAVVVTVFFAMVLDTNLYMALILGVFAGGKFTIIGIIIVFIGTAFTKCDTC